MFGYYGDKKIFSEAVRDRRKDKHVKTGKCGFHESPPSKELETFYDLVVTIWDRRSRKEFRLSSAVSYGILRILTKDSVKIFGATNQKCLLES